jgi:hypothetical protein
VASADIGDIIFSLLQLGLGLLAIASFGILRGDHLLLEFFDIGAVLAFTQLLLDCLDLLVQVVLALRSFPSGFLTRPRMRFSTCRMSSSPSSWP